MPHGFEAMPLRLRVLACALIEGCVVKALLLDARVDPVVDHRRRPHGRPPVVTRSGFAMKRTYQPSKTRRARTHGFLVRMKSRGGRAVINARRAKGRKRLAV